MHAIYMYVIHKRIGVIVSVTGVCFCIFLHSELLAYITFKIYFVFPISPAEVPKRSVVKKTASFDLIFQVLNDFFHIK